MTLKTTFFSNSPEATFAKCCKYTLFLYKNTFFSKNICVFAFFVVPLHPISLKVCRTRQSFRQADIEKRIAVIDRNQNRKYAFDLRGAIVYRLGQEIFIL